jgi:YVTN family beta-propeller protein
VIDGATNLVTATISVGRLPYGIAVNSSTNTIYVANFDDNTISVIDGVTNFVKTTVDVGTGSGPLGVAVNPTTNRVFVANDYSNTVSVIDGASSSLVATVPVGLHPIGVGVNPTTNRVYVANSNDNTVSVIADGPGSGANWAFPFAAGTSAQIGLYGIHDDNFSGMQDDRTHATFAFANYTATTALDIVLPPSTLGTSTIPATSVASGTVLAVWAPCQLVLIDHGNGWWATYLHLANIPVTSGDAVTTGSILGYPTTVKPTLSRCKNVNSSAEHVHLAFLRGSDAKRTGTFVTLLGQAFCSHRVLELNSDPTNIILKGLTTTKGQVFTVPSCG